MSAVIRLRCGPSDVLRVAEVCRALARLGAGRALGTVVVTGWAGPEGRAGGTGQRDGPG
jgi:hypothetical protein